MSTPARRPGDEVRASVGLSLAPAAAFEVFTTQVDQWWRRGRRFRNAPGSSGVVRIEPGVGGRLFESFDTEAGEQVVQIGRTLAWEPPHRLLLQWRAVNFAPQEHTEVEVLFQPTPQGGTLVTLIHRGWADVRADHPVRHRLPVADFLRLMGLWWGDQLSHLRLHTSAPPGPS